MSHPLPITRGILMIGGLESGSNATSAVEVIGFENCSVPDLPEARFDHGSFMTPWGLSVCGGTWAGKPWSSDCLVLNRTSKQWERGILGPLLGETVVAVVELSAGTYLVHPENSSFLPSPERHRIAGPKHPEEVQCATGISTDSFLVTSS